MAYRARPDGRLDAAGAARGRRPALGAARGRHTRRRRAGDRLGPAVGACVRAAAGEDHGGVRRARRGKPGHDSPFLLTLGTPGFGFGHGELWSAHLAFSGDAEYLAERLPESAGALRSVIGVGELLGAGEIRLAPGERYDAPLAIFTWSDAGLDGISDRLHRRLFDALLGPTQTFARVPDGTDL